MGAEYGVPRNYLSEMCDKMILLETEIFGKINYPSKKLINYVLYILLNTN